MSDTATLLAELRTERVQHTDAAMTEGGLRNIVLHRPDGVGIRNDGYRGFWMLAGLTYQLTYDGVGWRVTCRDWADGHVLRLVDAEDGREFAHTLLATDGTLVLEEGRAYELRQITPGEVWGLFVS